MLEMMFDEIAVVDARLEGLRGTLAPGGTIQIRHSNYDGSPGVDRRINSHERAFMNAALFAHLATKHGFVVVEQTPIRAEWIDGLDCVTVLSKL